MANFDLVNWTMQKARQLNPVDRMPSETEGSHLLDKPLEVLEGEQAKATLPANPQETISPTASAPSVQLPDNSPMAPQAYGVADGSAGTPLDFPLPMQAASLAPEDVPNVPMSALLNAIVAPDIYTAPADRERAITLRWVLRDIKANRLKLSPVDQLDLRDLIEIGLVEMRNDVPVLTNAGVSVTL
jgi:hypothetical protein